MPAPAPPGQLGPQGIPKPTLDQFSSNAPGSGAQVSGYNSAIQNLGKSLQLSQDQTSFGKMQLGQQLQSNQGQVAQSLTNRGLGNTTIANTMQQAPLQTYNMGMAQLGNLDAGRGMQAYGNLAGMEAQGGQAVSQFGKGSAQQQYDMQLQQMLQQQQMQQMQKMKMQTAAPAGGWGLQQSNLMTGMDMGAAQAAMSGQADKFSPQPWMMVNP